MRVLIERYPKVYNTPVKARLIDTEDEDEIEDYLAGVQQGFGQAVALTVDEAKEVLNQIKELKL